MKGEESEEKKKGRELTSTSIILSGGSSTLPLGKMPGSEKYTNK
jgi:hypothetical protein